jgi:hypothetical protein
MKNFIHTLATACPALIYSMQLVADWRLPETIIYGQNRSTTALERNQPRPFGYPNFKPK